MKSVLLSIQPKWCELIASGRKTVEIRKTKPKIEPPFKCYIYCTKPSKKYQTICGCMVLNSDELYRHPKDGIKYGDSIELMLFDGEEYSKDNFLNGKVIGEFICDEIINIKPFGFEDVEEFEKQTCLTYDEIEKYSKGKPVISWHISDLVIYEKPKELREFKKPFEETNLCYPDNCNRCEWNILLRPPQSWCYVEEKEK